ncbi:hypothetical protein SPSIL_021860 [Sporomusa silvacetica DSM 10669]|uniref:Bacterial mobilisation domain-containing protein n=1 Tax=Sporomusa silvacetica DSM 10669 TaxID=1123289 RepID=A0ABZ3IKT4_9FIRM|nr:hypothetical protein SPSIL_31870 [Sporomusa silvacetica DSM 10669]
MTSQKNREISTNINQIARHKDGARADETEPVKKQEPCKSALC